MLLPLLSVNMHCTGALAIASRQPSRSNTTVATLPLASVILPPILCHICSVTTSAAYMPTTATSDEHDISSIETSSSNISTIVNSTCSVAQNKQRFTDNALSIVFRWLIRVSIQSTGTTLSTVHAAALSKAINDTILQVVTLALDDEHTTLIDDHEDTTLHEQVNISCKTCINLCTILQFMHGRNSDECPTHLRRAQPFKNIVCSHTCEL
jgi:hypothetical protein